METLQIRNPKELNSFMAGKQREILALAQRNTEEMVKTEMALLDFELLLAINSDKKEDEKLVIESRKLREESWKELEGRFKGDHNKIMRFLSDF